MAITLQDDVLEAKIKEIGRRMGLSADQVIARAVENEAARLESRETRTVAERRARMDKVLSELPVPTDEERRKVAEAAEDMYDENGLPR